MRDFTRIFARQWIVAIGLPNGDSLVQEVHNDTMNGIKVISGIQGIITASS